MPSITGPYESPFDPHDRPPTWLVPLGQVREATLVALCKGCQHQRRWPVAELVARYAVRPGPMGALALLEVWLGRLSAVRDRQVGAAAALGCVDRAEGGEA